MLPSAGALFLALGLLVVIEFAYRAYKRNLWVERGVDPRIISCS